MNTTRPAWVNKKIDLKSCSGIKSMLRGLDLGTVCEEAMCPNIGECFSKGQATFLILGKNCTRHCSFCAVDRKPPEPVDADEPARVARGIEKLGLAHAVITSVTRDDLPDGGAGHFVSVVNAVRKLPEKVIVELLIPDFNFDKAALGMVVDSGPDIIAHNIETVSRLYKEVREGASYERSLGVLRYIKEYNSSMPVKSGIMLGLGEREEEVFEVFTDIVNTGCDFLSIGQYLSPSRAHFPVREYVSPELFTYYKKKAIAKGFKHVESGTYVRSSYHASEYLHK